MLSNDQIINNWSELMAFIDDYITGDRRIKLIDFYTQYQDKIQEIPASSNKGFHSCFPGGHVSHTLNVLRNALGLMDLWQIRGANINFSKEELVFAALNHDLGKMGDGTTPYYISNPSEWHVKNLGQLYKKSDELNFMTVPDRGLFLLQSHGIAVSENEYLAIKLHDGLYGEANEEYLVRNKPKSCIVYILHQADLMAARVEYEQQTLFAPKSETPNETPKTKSWNSWDGAKTTRKQIRQEILASSPHAKELSKKLKGL
jgi:hypothetical protein